MSNEDGKDKLEIKVDIDEYSENDLNLRSIATYQLFKADTLDLVLSILDNNKIDYDQANAKKEILAFAVFNCWHVCLNAFNDGEKANIFNNAMTVVYKHEYKINIDDDSIFKKYYEPMPVNGSFNEVVWPFWIFGKSIIPDSSDVESLMKIISVTLYFLGSINRSLNITLNLKQQQLMDFMNEVEKANPKIKLVYD